MLEVVKVEPTGKTNAVIIWLHGLGADGHDFIHVIPSLGLSQSHGIRFIFPHAPKQSVTINGGLIMPAWYDITAIDLNSPQDESGLKKSALAIGALIEQQQAEGVTPDRIVLVGFSQGGALALHTALRLEQTLGGVAALSSYLPLPEKLAQEKNKKQDGIPIFMAHGFMDPVVPYWVGQSGFSYLQKLGYEPCWHGYPMPHSVCMQELSDIGQWLRQIL